MLKMYLAVQSHRGALQVCVQPIRPENTKLSAARRGQQGVIPIEDYDGILGILEARICHSWHRAVD